MSTYPFHIKLSAFLLLFCSFAVINPCSSQETYITRPGSSITEKNVKLHCDYKLVFNKKATSCEQIWQESLLSGYPATKRSGSVNWNPYACASKCISDKQMEAIRYNTGMMQQKSYELWLREYKIELISIDLDEIRKSLKVRDDATASY